MKASASSDPGIGPGAILGGWLTGFKASRELVQGYYAGLWGL